MPLIEQILLGVALAMDCFTVSVSAGITDKRFRVGPVLMAAVLFGLFQALMPLLGWTGMGVFGDSLDRVDGWIAFGLLMVIGVKMIIDGTRPPEEKSIDLGNIVVVLALAVATSIDAFAVGMSFRLAGLASFDAIMLPVAVIGLISFLFTIAGNTVGTMLGRRINFRAEILGGMILIAIGLKILLS